MMTTTSTAAPIPSARPKPGAAALFDIDGTLVDSNYLHIEAWAHTFSDLGLPIDTWQVHRLIGMDASMLLTTLLGDDAEDIKDRAKDLHTRYYTKLMSRLRPIAGATDLLRELDSRGIRVVLATSSPANELEALRAVLDIEDALVAVTSAEDVETAKPEPDLVRVALEKAGADASNSVFVGDAVWDFRAAGKLGLTGVGVLTGGSSREALEEAGAVAVYDDVADLLAQLDSSPLSALWT